MKRLIYFIALMLAINFAMHAQFITIKGKQFYDENGNAFFPLQVNMGIDLTYNAWEQLPIVLTDSVISPDAFYFSAGYSLGTTNQHECDTQALCTEQLWHYLYKIKDMGFNCFRIHTMGVKYKPKNYAGAVFEDKFYMVINPNDPVFFPGDPAFRYLEISKPYDTNPFLNKILDSYETILTMADSLDIKVSFDIAPEGVTLSDNAISDYCEYLAVVGNRLKNYRNLLAHVVVEEPEYTDSEVEHTKQQVCEIMNSFYDTLKAHDPNHLITIGGHDIFDADEWDPTVMKMDFYQPHIYTNDSKPYDLSIEHQIERVMGRLYWIDKNCPMPWMIGEIGISCQPNQVQPATLCNNCEEQKHFADTTLKMTINYGGSGYSWWYFQENYDTLSVDFLKLNRVALGLLGHGDVSTDTVYEKPAVEVFRNFLDSSRLQPLYAPNYSLCTKPASYYDPFYHRQFYYQQDTILDTTKFIHGHINDQFGKDIVDAVVDGQTLIEWSDSSGNYFKADYHYTFTDENGDFTFIPLDIDSVNNQRVNRILTVRMSAAGADVHKLGEYPYYYPVTDNATYTLTRNINFKYDGYIHDKTITESAANLLAGWNSLSIGDSVTIESGVSGDITARQEIHLTGETHIEAGSEVHIYNKEAFTGCNCYMNFERMANAMVINSRSNVGIEQLNIQSKNMELDFIKPLEEFTVSIYPNPSKGIFNVDITQDVESGVSVLVTNSMGKSIKRYSSTDNSFVIDLTGESPGIYYIKISNNIKSKNYKLINF